MEPLDVVALVIFVSLLVPAAALEIFGLFHFTAYSRGLLNSKDGRPRALPEA